MSDKETSGTLKRAYVGIYREDIKTQSALVIPAAAFEKINRHNAVASAAQEASSWEELFEGFDRKEVEGVLLAVIGDVRHLAASGEDLPPIETLAGSDLWVCVFQPFDDWWMILHDLPDAVQSLARFDEASVMTEYSPCRWSPDDLPAIREILEMEGWEVLGTDFHPAWP